MLSERGDDPRPVIAQGLSNYPGDHYLRLLAAKAEIEHGDPEAALSELGALAAIDAAAFFDPLIAYDRRTFSVWPHALAGAQTSVSGASRRHARHSCAPPARLDAAPDERQEYTVKAQLAAARLGSLTSFAQ